MTPETWPSSCRSGAISTLRERPFHRYRQRRQEERDDDLQDGHSGCPRRLLACGQVRVPPCAVPVVVYRDPLMRADEPWKDGDW